MAISISIFDAISLNKQQIVINLISIEQLAGTEGAVSGLFFERNVFCFTRTSANKQKTLKMEELVQDIKDIKKQIVDYVVSTGKTETQLLVERDEVLKELKEELKELKEELKRKEEKEILLLKQQPQQGDLITTRFLRTFFFR